jgi:hypothetical protein
VIPIATHIENIVASGLPTPISFDTLKLKNKEISILVWLLVKRNINLEEPT